MPDKDLDIEPLSFVMTNLIASLVKYQKEYEFFYDEEVYKKIPDFPPGDDEEYTMKRYQHIAVVTRLTLQHIMKFAKKIPGFNNLVLISGEDAVTLLKAFPCEVFVLWLARKYNVNTDSIVMHNTLTYTRKKFRSTGMENFTDSLFHFCETMHTLEVDESEYALLAVIAMYSDRPGLLLPRRVESIQEFYVETLKSYVGNYKPQEKNRFARMLAILGELRFIASLHPELCLPAEIPPKEETWDSEEQSISMRHLNQKFI